MQPNRPWHAPAATPYYGVCPAGRLASTHLPVSRAVCIAHAVRADVEQCCLRRWVAPQGGARSKRCWWSIFMAQNLFALLRKHGFKRCVCQLLGMLKRYGKAACKPESRSIPHCRPKSVLPRPNTRRRTSVHDEKCSLRRWTEWCH